MFSSFTFLWFVVKMNEEQSSVGNVSLYLDVFVDEHYE